jgi:SAM-dependent methyltransferase
MTSKFEEIRRVRRLSGTVQAHVRLQLLRIGLLQGLFEELRSPLNATELAERLELAPDLVASWVRAAHAHRLVRLEGGRYRIDGFVRWLLDAQEAPAIRAILDQAALTYAPRLGQIPKLLGGAERPEFGAPEEALRAAAASRLLERRAIESLARVPGVRAARRVLDIGCGYGTYLAGFLARYRDANGLGVELDPSVAEEARRILREAEVSRRGEIRVGDFMTLDLAEGSYDLVLLNNNLYYFSPEERAALFERVLGCLAGRGVFALQTPVVAGSRVNRVLGAVQSTATFDLFLRAHRNLHGLADPDELFSNLREAGFGETGEIAIVPGGGLRYLWARRREEGG